MFSILSILKFARILSIQLFCIRFMPTTVFYTRIVLVSVIVSVTMLCDILDNRIMIV